ncbi:polyprenyl synthetase family protein [Streptomyces sp. NPDC058294]|uniref:polyprenyl synthetase family protein n=1 Tax=Streptomyces sp. NPDC058294 TaxID=3346430 RepID=UPI0036E9F5DE
MRPTQAKEHHAVAPPPLPRPVPLSGSPLRVRPDGVTGEAHGAIPPGTGDAGATDADVPAAVARVLDHFLADRVARARAMDVLFAEELAGSVVRFTRTGGKRARSQLLWWSLRACGGTGEALTASALRIGAALELLQTCALVHDDVMDGSVRRRGRPALHAELSAQYAGSASPRRVGRFGEAAGLLAGDLALAWSDDLVAETPLDPVRASAVRRLWSDMRTEMVAGQYLDVQGQITGAYSLSRTLRAACLKSARYSVERPLALGAALADADDATTGALRSAGRCAGMAFQLRDDLDDVFGDPRRTGKPCGGDIREGKPTYLVALARVRAETSGDRSALTVLRRALGNAGLTGPDLDRVREVLTGTGARAAVEDRIGRLIAQSLHHLDDARLAHEPGTRLRHLLAAAGDGPASTEHGPRPPCPDGRSASGDGGPAWGDGTFASGNDGPASTGDGPGPASAGPECTDHERPAPCAHAGPGPGDGGPAAGDGRRASAGDEPESAPAGPGYTDHERPAPCADAGPGSGDSGPTSGDGWSAAGDGKRAAGDGRWGAGNGGRPSTSDGPESAPAGPGYTNHKRPAPCADAGPGSGDGGSAARDGRSATGDGRSATGDGRSATGDSGPTSGDDGRAAGDGRSAAGDGKRASAGGGAPRPSAGDVPASGGPESVPPGGSGPCSGDDVGVSVPALLAGSGAKECGR